MITQTKLIENIIINQKDFHLLPRDSNGYCTYIGGLILTKDINNTIDDFILPDYFKINGDLTCYDIGIRTLPKGLIINGKLNCGVNSITKFPDDMIVTGDLWCYGNQLSEINVKLSEDVSLDCSSNEIKILPNNLKITDLWCSDNKIVAIPDDMILSGGLWCYGNNITSEIKCKIDGNIYMSDYEKEIYNRMIKIRKIIEKIC